MVCPDAQCLQLIGKLFNLMPDSSSICSVSISSALYSIQFPEVTHLQLGLTSAQPSHYSD